jgi:hypothetical protein
MRLCPSCAMYAPRRMWRKLISCHKVLLSYRRGIITKLGCVASGVASSRTFQDIGGKRYVVPGHVCNCRYFADARKPETANLVGCLFVSCLNDAVDLVVCILARTLSKTIYQSQVFAATSDRR